MESAAPSEDAVRMRAYELYLARGGAPGHELDDWLSAERALQVLAPTGSTAAPRTTDAP